MWRMRRASGQAAAKASHTREAVSMTRVPSFKRRSRRVANSAVASACALGIASRTVRISQYAAVCRIRRIWLASGLRQLDRKSNTSELQSHVNLVCRLLLEKKKKKNKTKRDTP